MLISYLQLHSGYGRRISHIYLGLCLGIRIEITTLLYGTRHSGVEISICILDYQESCKGKSASLRKQGVQRSLQGRMEEGEDMFHMLRLKYPFICQRLFLAQQTACTHQGWLCSTHIHTHMCGLALLFAQMWNSCTGRHRASSNTMPQSLSQYHLHSFYIPPLDHS